MSLSVYVLCKTAENRGMSLNADYRSKLPVLRYTACFLALLSFLPMKENYKKDLHNCKSERESECKGESKRVRRDSVYCLWEVNDGAA